MDPPLPRPVRSTRPRPEPAISASSLARNLGSVRDRIARACSRAGRDPASVCLVAVTKTVGAAEVLELARLGATDFGENRVPALLEKRAAVEAAGVRVRWHMIGHLQTNKLRDALPATDVLHSLDRPSLAAALAKELAAGRRSEPLPAFVQVNVSGEASKGGYAPGELRGALAATRETPGLRVAGLMTMAPLGGGAESARPHLRRLRELRDEARRDGYLEALGLSMGMSQDFEVAIEEGATHVRVGSLLFEGLDQG
jgi:pyridoxal phosphate enzyme (YggS family)